MSSETVVSTNPRPFDEARLATATDWAALDDDEVRKSSDLRPAAATHKCLETVAHLLDGCSS